MTAAAAVTAVDPFDLPEWLGTDEVTWTARTPVRGAHRVVGELSAGSRLLGCDLLGVDQAYPVPVVEEEWRRRAHQAWTYGEVLLVDIGGRTTLAVPGSTFGADLVLECLGRLAKAVGGKPDRYAVTLRL